MSTWLVSVAIVFLNVHKTVLKRLSITSLRSLAGTLSGQKKKCVSKAALNFQGLRISSSQVSVYLLLQPGGRAAPKSLSCCVDAERRQLRDNGTQSVPEIINR